jgi:Zn-dependent peptidase ImmA (M78 family)
MQRLRTTTKPPDFLAAEEIVETLLVEAHAAGELPTNQNKLLKFLGLEQMSFDFMNEVEFLEASDKPDSELRAALSLRHKVIATHSGLSEKRSRFSVFHEIAHCILPDHVGKIFVDTDQTLSWWTKARLEREANQVAADLLFQGSLFSEEALSSDLSVKSVLDLAPKYGASYEAALRRYTERHVVPCALIVYDKLSRNDESFVEDDEYRLQYTITSAPFKKLHFSGQLTGESAKASDIFKTEYRWRVGDVVEREIIIDGQHRKWQFEAEVFGNGYKIFQLLKRCVKVQTR